MLKIRSKVTAYKSRFFIFTVILHLRSKINDLFFTRDKAVVDVSVHHLATCLCMAVLDINRKTAQLSILGLAWINCQSVVLRAML